MTHDARTVDQLRTIAREALSVALGGSRRVALVNFPNHGNPGDPAIWLGTNALLADLGVRIGYRSAWWDLDPRALRRAVGDAPVLINGGGNFGDLYLGQQRTRMRVLSELPDNPVVQLPQSIHFADPRGAAAVADAIAGHGAVTLMVREHNSVRLARELLGTEPLMSPDHALGLGQLARTSAPTRRILWLARRPGDPEHVPYDEPDSDDVTRIEWIEGVETDEQHWDARGRLALRVNRAVQRRWDASARWAAPAHPLVAATYAPLARRWVRRGVDLLTSAEVVVTDKLHGHLLCALVGVPHVVLDNSYGKVSGTLTAWTSGLPGVHVARDGQDAYAQAMELLG